MKGGAQGAEHLLQAFNKAHNKERSTRLDQRHPHLPLKVPPPSPLQPPAPTSHPLLALRSRCIVGRKVVAIRPLRGLRGRSENPEIHYAFKSFIYFRITYILSAGGPTRRPKAQNPAAVHLFPNNSTLSVLLFLPERGILSRKVKIVNVY